MIPNINTNNVLLFLLVLLPPALVTGPAIPDITISLIALIFLIKLCYQKMWFYFQNKFVLGFIAFYILIIISGLQSFDPLLTLITESGIIFFFRYLFFILAIQYLCSKEKNTIKFFTISLILTIFLVTMDGYLQWITGKNLFGWEKLFIPYARLTGLFEDEPIIGHFLATLAPLAFALAFSQFNQNKYFPFFAIFFLILVEVLIFGSGERMAFLNIILFTIGIILLSKNFKKIRIIGFIISSVIIVSIGFLVPETKNRIQQTVDQVTTTSIPFLPYSPHHETHYITAIKMFTDRPMFGQGPMSFRYLCDKDKFVYSNENYKSGCATHPHNFYFQMLSELGLFAFLLLISYFLFHTKNLLTFFYQRLKKHYVFPDHLIFLNLIIFINLWPLIPHKDFFNNWSIILTILPIGFLKYYAEKNNE